MIQIINTQLNLESAQKKACCVSGLGRVAVNISTFWNLYHDDITDLIASHSGSSSNSTDHSEISTSLMNDRRYGVNYGSSTANIDFNPMDMMLKRMSSLHKSFIYNKIVTEQEAMKINVDIQQLDSWVAPTDIDPEMRPWINRQVSPELNMMNSNSFTMNEIEYTPTAQMRLKEKKQKEQSVLQLIMHPTSVNCEIIIRTDIKSQQHGLTLGNKAKDKDKTRMSLLTPMTTRSVSVPEIDREKFPESKYETEAALIPSGASMMNRFSAMTMPPKDSFMVMDKVQIENIHTINVAIKNMELSLNDHQLQYLIGIMETVIMPTSPVAVEHLTRELEIQHNDDHDANMLNVIAKRKKLEAEIHEIEWLLSSQYSRFVLNNNVLSNNLHVIQDKFWNYLTKKQKALNKKKSRLDDLEKKWSVYLMLSKIKQAEKAPIDQKLTNLFLTMNVENLKFMAYTSRVADEPFLTAVIDGFAIQIKEVEDLSGFIGIELKGMSLYNLLAMRDPTYHSWKDIITPWDMIPNHDDIIDNIDNDKEDYKVMISIQIKHRYRKQFREITNAEFNIAPLQVKITMNLIDTVIEYITGKNLEKQNKTRQKETRKRVSSNINNTISTTEKFKKTLSKTAKKMMLKPTQNKKTKIEDIDKTSIYEIEMKEEYQLITQFRNHAEIIIKKQTEHIKIWRLRIGSIYLLMNFTKATSTTVLNFALPSVFDMKLKIKPKTYNSKSNKEALDLIKILKRDYLKMLITKLPNTFLKHSFAQFFKIGHDDNHNNDHDTMININQEEEKKKKKKLRFKLLKHKYHKDDI